MSQVQINPGMVVLSEFVDDLRESQKPENRQRQEARPSELAELVHRIASEMRVPQYHLTAVVERVLAAVQPQIEARVRQELKDVLDRQERSYLDSFTG